MSINFGRDESKYNRQVEGKRKWSAAGGKGTLCYPTGFGKTLAGTIIYEPFLDKNPGTDYDVSILVPSAAIKSRWEEVIDAKYKDRVNVYTADELLTGGKILETKLLIVDEIDAFLAQERFKLIDRTLIHYKYILGLTANFEDRHGRHKNLEQYAPLVDFVSEIEALENGWISKYVEYNIGVDFDNSKIFRTVHIKNDNGTAEDVPMTKEDFYYYLSKEIQKQNAKFGNLGLHMAGLVLNGFKGDHPKTGQYVEIPPIAYARKVAKDNGWHSELDITNESDKAIEDQWNPNKVIGYAKTLFNLIRARKDMLYNAEEKFAVGKAILDKFPTTKAISFAESTEFADKFCAYINKGQDKDICVAYHSKIESRPVIDSATGTYFEYKTGAKKGQPKIFGAKVLKDMALNAIANGQFRVISTAKALDRGFNVEDIGLGLNHSRTSSFTQHNQRGGRSKRINPFDKNAVVIIVNLYMKYTKEEEWLREAQSKNTNSIYWVTSVEQIDYEPKQKYEFNFDSFY